MTNTALNSYIGLQHVTKQFVLSSGVFTALDDITIDFHSSEFTCVVGRSGSGKSTLMNMITGIDKPTSGKIVVEGQTIQDFSENERALWRGRNLGIVFQFYQLIPVLSLLENVMFPMQLLGELEQKACEERALELLSTVNLRDQAYQRPERVSGGQQQCAAIARALANNPPILIADEPTGNLGSNDAAMVLDIFMHLVDEGKTVIMVTHDNDLARNANRVIQLSDGRIIGDSSEKRKNSTKAKKGGRDGK